MPSIIALSFVGADWPKTGCLVATSTALTIVVADLAIRGMWPELVYYRPHEMFARSIPSYPMLGRYEPNVFFDGVVYGDLASVSRDESLRDHRNMRFVTDSAGFRNEKYPSGKIDIIVVGDSFSLGTGTTQDSTWVSLLSSSLKLNIYNLSMVGNPQRHFMNLQKELTRLNVEPGTIVLLAIFGGNDLDETYLENNDFKSLVPQNTYDICKNTLRWFQARSPFSQLLDSVLRREEYQRQVDKVLKRQFPNGRTIAFHKPYVRRVQRSPEEVVAHPNAKALVRVLGDMRRYSEMHSLEFLVVLLPAKEEVYRWCLEGRTPWTTTTNTSGLGVVVGDFCKVSEISFLDMKGEMVSKAQVFFKQLGQCLWWYDDTHMNHNGHKVIAAALHEHIRDHFLQWSISKTGTHLRKSKL